MKYKYNGKQNVVLINYGEVKPNDIINVDFEILNPDFEKIEKTSKIKNSNKK